MNQTFFLSILEKYVLPFLFIIQAIWIASTAEDYNFSFLELSKILKPLVIAVLMFFATSKQKVVNLKSTIGLLLSFGSIYFLSFEDINLSQTTSLFIFSSLIFYLAIGLLSILNLGTSFSIIPSINRTISTGFYSLIRHPIYSSYIHIFVIFLIINPNLTNIFLFFSFFFGLYLRSKEEETLLNKSDNYSDQMGNKNRFFNTSVSFPIILILGVYAFDHLRDQKNHASINISGPIFSLIPTDADDWSSFFVMNHIYPRFIKRSGEFRSNSIIAKKSLSCENRNYSLLSSECKRVVLNFSIQENIQGCNQKPYTLTNFRKELETILIKKNWILPNFEWCKQTKKCFIFDNVPNIQNHLESIYLRFGWSLFNKNDTTVGIMPNCFHIIEKDNNNIISRGLLESPRWELTISTSDKRPDVFLFENSANSTSYNNINFYNPIYYFLLVNGDTNKNSSRWINKKIIDIVIDEFSNKNVFSKQKDYDYLLSDFKKLRFNFKEFFPAKESKIFAIPDYLESCPKIISNLNSKIQKINSFIEFKCVNISEYIEFGVKKGHKWDAFLGPLTPGLPGKNALATQYFDSTSTDSWLGKRNPDDTRVLLLGMSNGSMSLKKDRFCSIQPNALGLSDLTIDDFRSCQSKQ